ncbi:MAG: hypothetical protein IJ617_05990 [Oscillospiraceae bacterium]|nr:hypothetical protein [Oscillospiraceae bacterium]
MENQLWNLFRETGEPMGYLLYRVDGGGRPAETGRVPETNTKDGAAPSF